MRDCYQDLPPDSTAELANQLERGSVPDQAMGSDPPSINFAEFVQHRFMPEFVASKRSSGRAHYRAILKHVLTPEDSYASSACRIATVKLAAVPGWPYLDSFALSGIDVEKIQRLTAVALQHGYSTQTVKHIRNVISSVFLHAIKTGSFTGVNPAKRVTLPAMVRREAFSFTLSQLERVMQVMHHPEWELALFALLTDLNVAECCGLQWKHVNLSHDARIVEGECLFPCTIAVRKQNYRGKLDPVKANRRRLVTVPQILIPALRDLESRPKYTGPEDFVLVTRRGTPIYPENLAARRLKQIGKVVQMPWLSWTVFRRTRVSLACQGDRNMNKEFERVIRRDGSRVWM